MSHMRPLSGGIVLQRSPSGLCEIEICNYRIGATVLLNRCCAFQPDLESIFLAEMLKILLQHNRGAKRTLSRHRRMSESDPSRTSAKGQRTGHLDSEQLRPAPTTPLTCHWQLQGAAKRLRGRSVLSYYDRPRGTVVRGKNSDMRRRDFITLLGGTAAAWPLVASAQQGERMRRIGILLPATADDGEYQSWMRTFLQGLGQSGWTVGRNLQVDTHWAGADVDVIRRKAVELVASAPDVILAHGNGPVSTLLQTTRTVPIVFPIAGDPVGTGLVNSLARPGGNATGFAQFEFSLSGKWLELLKQIAPGVARAAILRDAGLGTGTSQFAAIQAMAPMLRMEVNPINMRDADEIKQSVDTFARAQDGGLILTASGSAQRHRDLIISLAARYKLPAVYYARFFVTAGGLISYGIDFADQYRQAADYVDRILRGEKPADLPVQAPTKYELVINLKTAKTLGLEILPTLLARADEVIE
jgi:putative tryptophan/tyrosine transport system substrate-binding protein